MRVFVDTVSRCQERGRLYRSDCVRSQLVGPKESLSLREGADQRVRHGPGRPPFVTSESTPDGQIRKEGKLGNSRERVLPTEHGLHIECD